MKLLHAFEHYISYIIYERYFNFIKVSLTVGQEPFDFYDNYTICIGNIITWYNIVYRVFA